MLYNFEDLSFQILSVYRFHHNDGFFSVKPRPYAALSYRLRGRAEFNIAGRHLSASEGDVIFVPADMPYEVESFGSEILVVHLHDCNYREPEVFSSENGAALRISFLQLLESFSETHSVNRVKSILYDIFDRMESERKKALGGTPIDACLSYMEAHFDNPNLEIGEICAIGFMSQSSLQRAFRKYLGMSPKEYLIKLRIHKAVGLLVENAYSVKEIAFRCGFKDEKFFSRVIKQKYGISPSQLQKNRAV